MGINHAPDENRNPGGTLMKVKGICKRPFTFLRLLFFGNPTPIDIALLVIGTLAAIASGVPFPLIGILFGELVDNLNSASCNQQQSPAQLAAYQSSVNSKVLEIVYIGIGYFAAAYACVFCWNLTGERLAQRLREHYLKGLLRQEAGFFDRLSAGEASARLTGHISVVQQGTSEKVSAVLNAISFFVTAYIVAFIKNAKLAGELVSLAPAYLAMTLVGGYYVQKYSGQVLESVAAASSIAMESLTNITVVHAFGANARLETKFIHALNSAVKSGIKKATVIGTQSGLLYFIAFSGDALAFWQGSRFIVKGLTSGGDNFSVGSTYTVIFILVDASIILSQVAPFLPAFVAASSAFESLEKDMRRQPKIDGTDEKYGLKLDETAGALEVKDVSFTYPTRVEAPVLQNVSFACPPQKKTAIVGLSGSGKSTIAAMMLRLYDPGEGVITLDGHDVKSLNVASLRQHISLVQQNSPLLDRSILECIALGLINSPLHRHLRNSLLSPVLADVSMRIRDGENPIQVAESFGPEVVEILGLVEQAAATADAINFINSLDHGLGTLVGSSGALISGGQRQRIALARALVKNPSILILDEATASLDSATELRVQAAIDRATTGRTVVAITHRLSAAKNADNIVVMRHGKVVEQGTHSELLSRGQGEYADLVRLQQLTLNREDDSSKATEGDVTEIVDTSGTNSNSSSAVTDGKTETSLMNKTPTLVGSEPSDSEEEHPEEGKVAKEGKEGEDEDSVFRFMGSMFRPYLPALLIALIGVLVYGGTQPSCAVIFGNTIGNFSPCNSGSHILSSGHFFGLMFFILAIIAFFANLVSISFLGWIAEQIQFRVRVLSFRSLLGQDRQWHESAGRSPSQLLSVITKDGSAIGNLTGSTLSSILGILVNLIVAIILSHIIAWRIALVCLSVLPLLVGSGIMRVRSLVNFEQRHGKAFAQSIFIAVEAVDSIQMVAAYSLENEILGTYRRSLQGPIREITLQSAYATLWLAIAYAMGTFLYALAYWWGTKQVIDGNSSQTQFFIVLISLLVGAQLWTTVFTMAPEVSQARGAIARISKVVNEGSSSSAVLDGGNMDSKHDIEKSADSQENPPPQAGSGSSEGTSVAFKNVHFAYPARPDSRILRGLNFSIQPGQFAAIVGPSGAGKSTIVSLIERLYFPGTGAIEIDGRDITRSGGTEFRYNMSYVPQDSVLFEGTVRFNVGLGARPDREATDSEIEEACRLANIHETVMELPQGYDTLVGAGHGQLSGGQKQRLAIARALVRKPRLLLLDESTSALDAESERLLQDGFDQVKARGDVTVVAIAHRLYTIQKADVIFFIDGGYCVEHGTHAELMNRSEAYRINALHQTLDH